MASLAILWVSITLGVGEWGQLLRSISERKERKKWMVPLKRIYSTPQICIEHEIEHLFKETIVHQWMDSATN